jgi:hypothetical protein
MARSDDALSVLLVLTAAGALGYGLWALAQGAEMPGLYWLVAGGLSLAAANDRERFFASR